jgi:pyridoxamine 5'-phosphate oxidase
MAFSSFDGQSVHSRIVLFKGMIRGGFSFYTNYQSAKGKHVDQHPQGSLLFYWKELDTQVRMNGSIKKLSAAESDEYFASRDRLSQIGAWASQQSQKIESYQVLQDRMAEFEKKFTGTSVPRPPHWGGFHLIPLTMEFWFAKPGRLHERYCFERSSETSEWSRSLKFP